MKRAEVRVGAGTRFTYDGEIVQVVEQLVDVRRDGDVGGVVFVALVLDQGALIKEFVGTTAIRSCALPGR